MPRISEEQESHSGEACCRFEIQIGVITTKNPGKQYLYICGKCHKLFVNDTEITSLRYYTGALAKRGRHGEVIIRNTQAKEILGTGFVF